ncbi:MAG TPA: tetratricopeptide repeat protein [Candidatus Angelobacter sp.]|nr:tetratricopeptide repeat protein [Candidatus Angelobacter sp.]
MPSLPRLRTMALLAAVTVICVLNVCGQTQEQMVNDPERTQAFELYRQNKMPEAAALLEKVSAKYPNDAAAHEALGVSLLNRASTQTDPENKKADRLRARAELLRARELGDNSDLSKVMLAGIPEDGSELPFSANQQVQATMDRGEAFFAKGDFDQAIREYTHALELDPKLYRAALYVGDMYFRQKQMDQAAAWFAKASQIDPGQESAYRYWGDSLLLQGKMKEARAKYIEGVVANPYEQTSWNGLNNWVHSNHLNYKQVSIQLPKAPTVNSAGGTNITIDPSTLGKKDGGEAWMIYSMERALWHGEKFSKEFPQEKSYRHTLKEEASALGLTATVFAENQKRNKIKDPSPSLVLLSQLKTDGMIEPYVLLVIPDAGIMQDYPGYREANRQKLIAFVDKYIVPATP